jgi:hypothetical protein
MKESRDKNVNIILKDIHVNISKINQSHRLFINKVLVECAKI